MGIISAVGLLAALLLAFVACYREKHAEAAMWLGWAIMFKLNLLNS